MAYRTVHKFPLGPEPVSIIETHTDAKILCVENQQDTPMLWLEVRTDQPKESREFVLVPTGGPVEPAAEYVGSVHNLLGWMVLHVYERPWERKALPDA